MKEKDMFRLLRADEIDCRAAMVKENGLSLLLYKDARCDMNILDETVGPMNWTRSHSRDNANCSVSLWDKEKNQWISKEDTGTESNTEKEKGLASDSFKRACFNWGIGRELYTAPFIWIKNGDCNITSNDFNGRKSYKCNDSFCVKDISYDDNRCISYLVIANEKTGQEVYRFGKKSYGPATEEQFEEISKEMERTGVSQKQIESRYKLDSINNTTEDVANKILEALRKSKSKAG